MMLISVQKKKQQRYQNAACGRFLPVLFYSCLSTHLSYFVGPGTEHRIMFQSDSAQCIIVLSYEKQGESYNNNPFSSLNRFHGRPPKTSLSLVSIWIWSKNWTKPQKHTSAPIMDIGTTWWNFDFIDIKSLRLALISDPATTAEMGWACLRLRLRFNPIYVHYRTTDAAACQNGPHKHSPHYPLGYRNQAPEGRGVHT